jgi:acetate kinase
MDCVGTGLAAWIPASFWLCSNLGLKDVETILTKSGLLGISGISNDARLAKSDRWAPPRRYFVYRAAGIGALAAVLRGIDALIFTAGIGENSAEVRRRICDASSWLGIDVDPEANARKASRISRDASRVSAWVIPTNEELMIARHTGTMLGLVEAPAS